MRRTKQSTASSLATNKTQRNAAWSGSWASLRDLEVFQAVIEERKTTAAAERLGISQPAVSRVLSSMEQRSNRTLFAKHGRLLVPTADAMALYEQMQPIYESLAHLSNFGWAQEKPVILRVACPPTIAHCFLEELIAAYMRANPEVVVSLEIVSTSEVLELVADRRADIGIADVDAPHSGLQRSVFRRSQLVCVLPETHPLCTRTSIAASELDGEALVMLAKRNPIRTTLDRLFSKVASAPRVVLETTTALSAVKFVSEGLGITLLNPFPVLLVPHQRVIVRPFTPSLEYETSLFTSSAEAPTAAMRRFMEYIQLHSIS